MELRRLANDLPVLSFQRQERRLEDAFVDILRGGANSPKLRLSSQPPPLPGATAVRKEERA
jgi:hypothetical protein